MNHESRLTNKKTKRGFGRRAFIFGALIFAGALSFGAWILAEAKPAHFTTTLDIAHKQILDDPTDHSWADLLSDVREKIRDVSGTLLAAAGSRFIHVRSGMRKEEVADLLAEKLKWSDSQKLAFASADEGTYYPGTYTVPSSKDEEIMRELMQARFKREVEDPFASSTTSVVNLETILKIASLIEREAGSKSDMRVISGVIWNRIWSGMTLDIDATLQYAKADKSTSTDEVGWWPKVESADKKLVSPYNTYKNKGLPPTPISSSSDAAIDAALNPKKTDCLFYLHDARRKIHCAKTYTEHKKNIERYLR